MEPTAGGSQVGAWMAHETGHDTVQAVMKNHLPMFPRYGMTVVHEPIGFRLVTDHVQNRSSSTLESDASSSSPLLNQICVQAFNNNEQHDRYTVLTSPGARKMNVIPGQLRKNSSKSSSVCIAKGRV